MVMILRDSQAIESPKNPQNFFQKKTISKSQMAPEIKVSNLLFFL
ncbi:hypothetical protein Metbo_2260 [Methanobacterium lacus]|uniref:Uncharacterized protein n=1 Tax=Methanobacterium lacus (strain AL-21) TaxID=877455 RepID=F0TCT4_METLA|nr:hypothetical protein Metbo_2260 [Methanobacterium lacus]